MRIMSPHNNKFLLLVGPSGAGKTTIVKRLVARMVGVQAVPSFTTRAPRTSADGHTEVNGVDYHFITVAQCLMMLQKGQLAEHIQIGETHYGFVKAHIDELLDKGWAVAVVTPEGVEQLSKMYPDHTVSVYMQEPSGGQAERAARMAVRDNDPDAGKKREALDAHIKTFESQADFVISSDHEETTYDEMRMVIQQIANNVKNDRLTRKVA